MKSISIIQFWKYPNIEYMIKIDEALENWLKEKEYIRKGRGKHEIAKFVR